MTKKERSWIMYDWANSAYSMAVTSSILPIYYASLTASRGIAESTSTAYWGYSTTIATLLVAFIAPILGTIADYKGNKKKFFTLFVILGVISTATLSLVGNGNYLFCLAIYIISTLGFSGSNLFYDSFLIDMTTEDRYNKISTLGFGFGYIGSCIPFIISIGVIMNAEKIGLTTVLATQLSFLLTAAWWFIFSLPMFKNAKQEHYIERDSQPIRASFKRLFRTFKKIKTYRNIVIFLIAYFFYIDGVHTIITMATKYGIEVGLDSNTLMIALLVVQIIAFPFAILYGWLADKLSAKFMLLTGILIYIVITILGYLMDSAFDFWVVAVLVATSQGGIQALSRSVFGKLVPKENSAEFFGFYSIFGKFSAAIGPTIVAVFAMTTGNSRNGVLSLVILFIIGGIMLSRLNLSNIKSADKV